MGFEAAIELIEQRCFQIPAGKIVYTDEKDGLIDFERFVRLEKKLPEPVRSPARDALYQRSGNETNWTTPQFISPVDTQSYSVSFLTQSPAVCGPPSPRANPHSKPFASEIGAEPEALARTRVSGNRCGRSTIV